MDSKNKKTIIRIVISVLVLSLICLLGYFALKNLGLTNLTREELQEKLSSTGAIAPLVFILISFLQVSFLPIPGMVTILAGNYLFGFWLSFIYSYIGMILGSIVAFIIGRVVGRPFINWVAGGKENADEWIKKLKGREIVLLFFAFLLPLFPDDLLCSVAGILPISFLTFFIMQLITRFTSIGASLIFMSGDLIPFSGWGIYIHIAIILISIVMFIFSIKYADKLNEKFDFFINKLVNAKKNKKI